jgi:hypothetical protein
MVQSNKLGMVYMALYVDDCYEVGHAKAADEAIAKISGDFRKLKIENEMTDYLSCEIRFDSNKEKAWLSQPHLLKRLEKKCVAMVQFNQTYQTPGMPGLFIIICLKEGDTTISEEDQKMYGSGIGRLLYLVKPSRPNISDAARELSKGMGGATEAAFKEMKCVIKFVLDTKMFGLKLQPKLIGEDVEWAITVFTDSDWAGDQENIISTIEFVVFLLGAAILCK